MAANLFRASFLTEFEGNDAFFRAGARLFFGDLFRQPNLAQSLATIAEDGAAFYRGKLAERLVCTLNRSNGLISHDDLASYTPEWQAPLTVAYKPAQGCLPNLQAFDVDPGISGFSARLRTADTLHIMIESMKLAIAQAIYGGDPDFAIFRFVKSWYPATIPTSCVEKSTLESRNAPNCAQRKLS
ncbi:MAG: gamma-glutamyltransferase [Burkholderiales bacterium]|nr:gamma-glutamyltransferase [Burkholderiales bacterium]